MAERAFDWARLGRLTAAERSRQGLSVQEFARASDISVRTLQRIEGGRGTAYRNVTLTRLEDALGWRPGSVDVVLGGGEPERTRDPQLERLGVLWASLTPRQRRALLAFVEEIVTSPRP